MAIAKSAASIHDVGGFLDLSDRSQRLLAGGRQIAINDPVRFARDLKPAGNDS